MTAAWRQDDINLLTGTDLEDLSGVVILGINAAGAVITRKHRDGNYVRLMQPDGTDCFLLCTNDHILETTTKLQTLRRFKIEGFVHAWKAERSTDGTTLVSAGYGAFMARFAADGSLIKNFGRASDLPAEIAPFFYASFQVRGAGSLLVANWQGHGPENGHKGRQLLEFSSDGRFIGSWSSPTLISSLQGLLTVDDDPVFM